MKVIDLLDKIANGEEEPKEFNYRNDYQDDFSYFLYDKLGDMTGKDKLSILLNDEIEIIEEPKKIEELDLVSMYLPSEVKVIDIELQNKLNEIIDYINSKEE